MSKREHAVDMPLTNKAIAFANKKHEGQERRVSQLPYIVHSIMVMSFVLKYKESGNIDNLCAAAVLHDVEEDCGVTHNELAKEFNESIARLVDELTNDEDEIRRIGKRRYLDRKLVKLSSYALVIKLADILVNTTDSPRLEAVRRMVGHCKTLLDKRGERLSSTHRRLIAEILWNAETLHDVR